MEGIGAGIGRVEVDLAADGVVAGATGGIEQVLIQKAREPASARGAIDDDPVDIDKPLVALLEPVEIGIVVGSGVIEGDQEGV